MRELRIEDADELVVGPAGIQKRPEHVEDAALAFAGELLACLGHGFEGGMIQRGKEEAETAALDAFDDFFLGQIDADAERFEHVRPARLGGDATIAMLRHAHAPCGEDEHGGGGDIEEVELVPPGADDIQHRALEL